MDRKICNKCHSKRALKFFREGRTKCRHCENAERGRRRRQAYADEALRHGRVPLLIARKYFLMVLARHNYNIREAARMTGIGDTHYGNIINNRMAKVGDVAIDHCDLLCINSDHNLYEIFDDLEEWIKTGELDLQR